MALLPIWFSIKESYNQLIITLAGYIAGYKYGLHVKEIEVDSNSSETLHFIYENSKPIIDFYAQKQYFEFDIILNGKSVFFNTPMTLAIIIAISIIFSQAYKHSIGSIFIGMSSLLLLHVTTFIVMSAALFASVAEHGHLAGNYLNNFYLPKEFLDMFGKFLNSYAVYFEPFLIGLITYFSLKKEK